MSHPTFTLLFVGLSLVIVLRCAWWARHGHGYWPTGWLGMALVVVFVIGIPLLFWLTMQRLTQTRPWFWFFPPLDLRCANVFLLALSPNHKIRAGMKVPEGLAGGEQHGMRHHPEGDDYVNVPSKCPSPIDTKPTMLET